MSTADRRYNYTDKLNAINKMVKEYGGPDAQIKTFSGYIDECWREAMAHSDTQLKTASKPSKAAAPKAAPQQKPGINVR